MIQIILLDNGVRVANIDYPNNHLVFGIERTNIIEIFDSGKKVVSAPYTEFINELGEPFLTPQSVITTLELSYLNLVSQEELDVEIADRIAADTVLSNRTTILENNEYKILYFQTISTATGTITKPTNSTIILDQFYSGGDAIVETLVNGQPSGQSPLTSGGSVVSVTSFDINGNYNLSGTPSSFDVALLYILKIKAIDYGNIIKANELNREEVGLAPIYSPVFKGIPEAPKQALYDATDKIATTEWVRDNAVGCLHRNRTGGTPITGVITQQLVDEHLIDGGVMEAGYDLYNELNVNKNLDNGNFTVRILYNSTNSLSGATVLATYTSTTANNQASCVRNFGVISATITELLIPPTTSAGGDFIGTSNTPVTQLNIDWTQPIYILWSIQNTSALDTSVISRNKLWKK